MQWIDFFDPNCFTKPCKTINFGIRNQKLTSCHPAEGVENQSIKQQTKFLKS
jgi:hypothetical protein